MSFLNLLITLLFLILALLLSARADAFVLQNLKSEGVTNSQQKKPKRAGKLKGSHVTTVKLLQCVFYVIFIYLFRESYISLDEERRDIAYERDENKIHLSFGDLNSHRLSDSRNEETLVRFAISIDTYD